ncbi:MAG: hypothetical protein ASARMPRED_000555 [Alectoria sarmentosa]|nr:MAG: hypothetical protein ASARMPRED_000555 [Alectoria sarmentosa]
MALSGSHTAGIYADLTLDGPEIGTLVVIVDRARNLPNRKAMGKQDPYCAARLGKEAKKTETDKRGGQTPKWDQEMRFTVHDSPDYYQLKVSVFNDDKKTELIGETWIALDQIVVPGGGANDLWHRLNCKGRYAGDLRIELTYYDTRAKEKVERRQSTPIIGSMDKISSNIGGPRQPKPINRREINPSHSTQRPPPRFHTPPFIESPPENEDDFEGIDPEYMDDCQIDPRLRQQKTRSYAWPNPGTIVTDEGPSPPPPPIHRFIPHTMSSPYPKVESKLSSFQGYQPHSAVPFSPDSFEIHNQSHGNGPIIGNNGRIIDPSDHLPTDTWAPEPEKRRSPQGAQPMPPAGRRPLNESRTQSASTPLFANNTGSSLSNASSRNRLAQSSRVSAGNIPPPVPGKVPIGVGKEDWRTDALSEEMRRIDLGSGRRGGNGS